MKDVWVARCSEHLGKWFEYDLSPKFDDVSSCQKYIDEHLKDLENLIHSCFVKILEKNGNYLGIMALSFKLGSYIRCYNLEQKRFADGFDF